jgi:high frequency lysogenization protein
MNSDTRNRAIALAGMFQAARLVQQTARGERRDAAASAASLGSIFNTDPDSVLAVYGAPAALQTGLEVLLSQLGTDNKQRDMELTGYVITLLHLERKLARQPGMLDTISAGIDKAREQAGFFSNSHPAVIAGLAEIYQQTISTLRPRIMVQGEQAVLAGPDSQNMIRALLLAGMRAAVLWRQCGGNRMKLIFQRKALLECSRELLLEARQPG